MLLHPSQALLRSKAVRDAIKPKASGPQSRVAGYDPQPVPKLTETDRVEPTVQPADFAITPDKDAPPTTDGSRTIDAALTKKYLEMGERAWSAAKAKKVTRAAEVYEARAAVNGNPWYKWDSRRGCYFDARQPGWQKRGSGIRYENENFLTGKVLQQVARDTRNEPSVGASPFSTAQVDVQGAEEARFVLPHFEAAWNAQDQIRAACWERAVGLTPLWKHEFDPSATDILPRIGPDGTVQGVFEAKCGVAKRGLVRWEEWYTDHNGDMYDEAGNVLLSSLGHVRPVRTSELLGYYKNGKAVAPEKNCFGDSSVFSLLASVNGYYQAGQGDSESEYAWLKQWYFMPTPMLEEDGFPDGLVLTWANGVVLDVRNMTDGFPFVPIYFTKVQGDVDGLNLVTRLLPSQVGYNRILSKSAEFADLAPFKIIASKQTSFTPNAFKSPGVEVIDVSMGPPPNPMVKPPMPAEYGALMEVYRANIDSISGISSMQDMGAQDASAAAIQLRMDADLSVAKDSIANLLWSLKLSAEKTLALVGRYYGNTPRLWMQTGGDPAQAQSQAKALSALTAGAKVRVTLKGDSATPRTPAMQMKFFQDVMGMLEQGVDPRLVIAYLKQADMYGTDDLAAEMMPAVQQIIAEQQQEAQAKQQLAAQAQEHQGTMAAIQQHQEDAIAQRQEQVNGALEAIKQHGQMMLEQMKQEFAAQNTSRDAQLQILLKGMPSVAGAMDPAGVVDWEKQHGIEGEEPPPPTVAPATQTKPKSGTKK